MTLTLTRQEKIGGWFCLLLQMLALPVLVALVCPLAGIRSEAAMNLICFLLNAVLAVVFFRRLLLCSLKRSARYWMQTLWTAAKGFALYWLLNSAVLTLILTIQPDYANVNDASVNTMIDEFPVPMTLAVIFAAPLAEECLFRGWMFTGLAQRSIPLAYCVTAAFFSAVHVVNYVGIYDAQTLGLCFLQYLGPSVALCRTCQKADSLCAPLLLHMAINTLACIVLR